MKQRQQDKDLTSESDAILPHPNSHSGNGHQGEDLSRDDLLFLLSILEGELQARDEVIGILKAEKMDLALLEAQYGFVTPKKVLEALQRDAFQAKSAPWQEDIYEKPMNELDKVVEKHKESHRRILEQLLMVEKSHRQTILELEEEKRKHKEYMEKSDEFIGLLEQECESASHGRHLVREPMALRSSFFFHIHQGFDYIDREFCYLAPHELVIFRRRLKEHKKSSIKGRFDSDITV
ncbi:Filamin A-interacting protein 1-like [Camelus dromedarius]|uniref:Filamin A-interacting protein 1-like n=1 Tax=Camelus dromedarius TaxID=9838 RepID=A0A5N4EJ13_CAMDR|nr:Filamin A-interacting protein 1-like [Camelus dromedarius]